MSPHEIATDAVRQLLETQLPWGEWALLEAEAMQAVARLRRVAREWATSEETAQPKPNTFRTVVAVHALSQRSVNLNMSVTTEEARPSGRSQSPIVTGSVTQKAQQW